MSDTVRSSVLSVTRTPARFQAEQGVVLEGSGRSEAWDVRGRAQVEPGPAPDQLGPRGRGRRWPAARGRCARGRLSSVRRTWAAPPHSPAWAVTWRPLSRARPMASGVDGRVGESVPRARRGPRRRGRRGCRWPRGRGTNARLASGGCERMRGRDEVDVDPTGRRRSTRACGRGFDHLSAGQAPFCVWRSGAQRTSA